MKASLLVVATISILSLCSMNHEYYVTITELNLKNDTLQVAVKIFTDDLEQAIEQETGEGLFLDHSTSNEKALEVVSGYEGRHIKFSSDEQGIPITWIGIEYDADATWLYGFALLPKGTVVLEVKNDLMIDQHHEQQNIIRLTNGSSMQTQICTRGQSLVRFPIN